MRSVIFLSAIFHVVSAGGHGTIRIVQYDNPNHKDSNDLCCESLVQHNGCPARECDPYFSICIDRIPRSGSCAYGSTTTRAYDNTDSIKFASSFGGLSNPVSVRFPIWQGGIHVQVTVNDYDDDFLDKTDDPIGDVAATLSDPPSKGQIPYLTTKTFSAGEARITLEYGFVCDTFYYGDCGVYCKADPIHFNCGNNGKQVCLPGWKGSGCLINATRCMTNPCQNNATCVSDVTDNTTCICLTGFTGNHCETKITSIVSKTSFSTTTMATGMSSTIPGTSKVAPSTTLTTRRASKTTPVTTSSSEQCDVNVKVKTTTDTLHVEVSGETKKTPPNMVSISETVRRVISVQHCCGKVISSNSSAPTNTSWKVMINLGGCDFTRYNFSNSVSATKHRLCQELLSKLPLYSTPDGDGGGTAGVVGGTVAAIASLAIIVLLAVFIRKKYMNNKVDNSSNISG